MSLFRRTFESGRQNLDVDNRLLKPGEYRELINGVVINSEGSNEGVIQKSYSNKRLTNLNFGPNVKTISQPYTHEARNRIYWLVKSDTGCFLVEWDHDSQSATFVLQDTRPLATRVLNLDEDFLCTSMDIISSDDPDRELMFITVANLEPLCINISRAKTYGENGFDAEDIFLIKKPPRLAPIAQLLNNGSVENNIIERFLAFTYRFKYLDGEYSAFATFSNYRFIPGKFDIDYETFENKGMVNAFNQVRLGFNTGDKRVIAVQLIYKNSNSNTPYLIDTFYKKEQGWGDNETRYHNFVNNKLYTVLPERELYRTFDNVPRSAQASSVIGNRPFYGNYIEGYDIVDANGNPITIDFTLSLKTSDLTGVAVTRTISAGTSDNNVLTLNFTGIELKSATRITFDIDSATDYNGGAEYSQSIEFILNRDYVDVADLAGDEDFIIFIEQGLTNNFTANKEDNPPANSTVDAINGYTITGSSTTTVSIQGPSIVYKIDDTPGVPDDNVFHFETSYWDFTDATAITFNENESAATVKTNRSYEVCLLYEDKWGRKTTALTSVKNTIFVPQSLSASKNSIVVTINNTVPYFADRYRVVVKSERLVYQTIYASIFFEDGESRWVKLDGESRDKVQEGDYLIVKKDLTGPIPNVVKVKVLELGSKEQNFISGNNNDQGAEIIEPAGLYMRIQQPAGLVIDYNENEFIVSDKYADAKNGRPFTRTDGLSSKNEDDTWNYVAIPQGSIITIFLKSFAVDRTDSGPYIYEKTFVVQADYDNFKEWYDSNVSLPLEVPGTDREYTNVVAVYGLPEGENTVNITDDPTDGLFLVTEGLLAGNGSKKGYLNTKVTIRLVDSLVIFETEPEQTDVDLYFETEQTFEVVDGKHMGNIQNQTDSLPGVLESNFFNCFAMGNGAESYRVKDALNKRYLATDLKPTGVDLNGYKEIHRTNDITYGETYNQSSNINGVNVFNLSTANFKDDLEDQFGSIQKMYSRNDNIVVFQEEKTGQVFYDKDEITAADGSTTLVAIPGVLGRYIPYQGSFGIGKHPESFSVDDEGRIKYASVKKGTVIRLSTDGISKITYGLSDFFRNLFIKQPNAKVVSGYDPYLDKTDFAIGNEPEMLVQFTCGNYFVKSNQGEAFSYEFKLNNLGGDIKIDYDITSGSATIVAEFNNQTYGVSNVSGPGALIFERDSLVENIVTVTITPIGGVIDYSIGNTCPLGSELKIVSVVLNDGDDEGQTIVNQFKWNTSSFASNDELFNDPPLTRFDTRTGIEGQGIFPANGGLVTIQSFKDMTNNGHFSTAECNRLGYLISSTVYNSSQYQAILDNPDTQFLTVTTSNEEFGSERNFGNFLFSRTSVNEILYLIWDYTSRNPVLTDDSASVQLGQSVVINELANDEVGPDAAVTISIAPLYGTAVVNSNRTITYTHNGSENFSDVITYQVNENGCSSTARIFITVGVGCGGGLSASGGNGIYETTINLGTDIGYCGIQFNSQSVPDRWQLFWGGTLVADSKYTGDGITAGPPTSYPGLLGPKTLPVFVYNGTGFTNTGNTEDITVIQTDIANNVTEPTDGNGFLTFNKATSLPTSVTLRTTGPVGGTAWNLNNVICPVPAGDLIDGVEKLMHGFFNEPAKGNKNKSIKVVHDTANNKFYTNIFGDDNFTIYNEITVSGNNYMNDGTLWYRIDTSGNILEQGTL